MLESLELQELQQLSMEVEVWEEENQKSPSCPLLLDLQLLQEDLIYGLVIQKISQIVILIF